MIQAPAFGIAAKPTAPQPPPQPAPQQIKPQQINAQPKPQINFNSQATVVNATPYNQTGYGIQAPNLGFTKKFDGVSSSDLHNLYGF